MQNTECGYVKSGFCLVMKTCNWLTLRCDIPIVLVKSQNYAADA